MKRCVVSVVALTAFPLCAIAVPGNLPGGSNLTTNGVTVNAGTPSEVGNPALLGRALGQRSWALQGFKLPALAIELGPVDGFVDSLDELELAIDAAEQDEQISAQEFDEIEQQFQSVLIEMGNKAEVGFDLAMPLPTLPVVFRAFDGVMAVHLSAALSGVAEVLDGDLELADQEILTNSAVYVRAGSFTQVSVDYGRQLMPYTLGEFAGEISVGGRLKVIHASLSRQVASLDSDDDDETAFDRAEENYDLNEKTSLGVGLDVGAGFDAGALALGVTVRNLVPAEFDYADIGRDCASKDTETQRQDCLATAAFIISGDVAAKQSFKLDTQLFIESSYEISNTGFTVFGGLELNKVKNVAGNEYQWLSAGMNYAGPWWIPAIRLGWRSNLAGSKLDVISLGLNLFNVINIEAFQALDSVEYEGDSLPRSAGFTLGFGGTF